MTKAFARFARKAKLASHDLERAAEEVAAGHCDADLGGNVFKQRIARDGGGMSGGFRTIILFKVSRHGFFQHGFAKNDKANVTAKELKALKKLAEVMLEYSEAEVAQAVEAGELIRIGSDAGQA